MNNSTVAALLVSWCGPSYEPPTEEELEAQRREIEERNERMKHEVSEIWHYLGYSRVEGESGAVGMKLLRDKNGVMHWLNTKVWPFHYPFCVAQLGETRTLQEFNELMYTGKDRSMVLATVVAYPAPDQQRFFCVEFNQADPLNDLKTLDGFLKDVRRSFRIEGSSLYFHPTSSVQIEAIKGTQLSLPVITSDTLFHGTQYKLIQAGHLELKPIVVFDSTNYTEDDLNRWLGQRTVNDIVVIPVVPADIPVVAGVICGEIIPPLCHVALLCQNRKMACCFIKDCTTLLKKFDVEGEVGNALFTKSGFFVERYGPVDVNESEKRPHVTIEKPNTLVTQPIDLHDAKYATDIHVVGAKAAQLAKVEAIYKQPIFNGSFIIPFHHYEKHVYLSHKPNYVPSQPSDVTSTELDGELVKSVIDKINQHNMTSVIFRSSTNAEDLTGFNGAGLYESVSLTGKDLNDPEKVGKAIKAVWASVWSSKAVKERNLYQINQRNVNMAILVQPFIDDKMTGVKVHYNGVCITHDVSRHKVKHGFVVNCYPGTKRRATNYYKDSFPEQTTIAMGREANSIDRQLNATATGETQSVITQEDAVQMVKVFGQLHSSMLNKPHQLDDTVALDVEFMVVDNTKTGNTREVVVLQARPYTVNEVSADLEEKFKEFVEKAPYKTLYGNTFEFYSPLDKWVTNM